MNCAQVVQEDIAEKYLLGELGAAEQEAFESHYFVCPRCLEEVEACRVLVQGLQGVAALAKLSPLINRGGIELGILAVLENRSLHGCEVVEHLAQQTGGVLRLTVALLYPVMYRLEGQGFIQGEWGQTAAGRRRRYYHLTAAGRKKLAPRRAEWRSFLAALERSTGAADA